MKQYKLKKDTLAASRDGNLILKCGKLSGGTVLNQIEILNLFDLTEADEEFSEWFEEIEPKEFTRSDMLNFGQYFYHSVYPNITYIDVLNDFLKERSKQNESGFQ
jgi:hypothetical protein